MPQRVAADLAIGLFPTAQRFGATGQELRFHWRKKPQQVRLNLIGEPTTLSEPLTSCIRAFERAQKVGGFPWNATVVLQGTGPIGILAIAAALGAEREAARRAVGAGAVLRCGGRRVEGLRGHFYAPTVLTGVDHTMAVMREESFGPVIGIMKVASDGDAVRLMNDSDFGLTAAIWTSSSRLATS